MRYAMIVMWILMLGSLAMAREAVITIADVPAEGKRVELYLRTGEKPAEFALTPGYNRTWHDVDLSKAKVDGDKISGPVTIKITSDGWHPKEPFSLTLDVTADLNANNATVTRDGKALNASIKALTPLDTGRLTLDCQNIFNLTGKEKNHFAQIVLGIQKGQTVSGRIEPTGSITDTSYAARMAANGVGIINGEVAGMMEAQIRPQGKEPQRLIYVFRSKMIGPVCAGTVIIAQGDTKMGTGYFIGLMEKPAPAAEDMVTLTLHEALGPGGYMKLYLHTRDGKVVSAFATTPNFNNATHTVDATALTAEDNTIQGAVKVTVNPDPWQPKDGKPIACKFKLKAKRAHGEWTGWYEGQTGDKPFQESINGGTETKPTGKIVSAMIKLENALVGGNDWSNRVFLTCDLDGEKITGGKISNNHTKLAGVVDGGQLKITGERFEASPQITVKSGDGTKEITYTFELRGVVVGKWIAGSFDTIVDGKKAKSGTFWAALGTK